MPKYSFVCSNCGEKYTVNVKWEEKEGVICPQCSSGDKKQDYSSLGVNSGSSCARENIVCPSTGMPFGMKKS